MKYQVTKKILKPWSKRSIYTICILTPVTLAPATLALGYAITVITIVLISSATIVIVHLLNHKQIIQKAISETNSADKSENNRHEEKMEEIRGQIEIRKQALKNKKVSNYKDKNQLEVSFENKEYDHSSPPDLNGGYMYVNKS